MCLLGLLFTLTTQNTALLNTCRKCPKISYTKVSNKLAHANSVDPDQMAPGGAVDQGSAMFAIPLSILRNNCIKGKT